LSICQYATHLHDPETDTVAPLAEADVYRTAERELAA